MRPLQLISPTPSERWSRRIGANHAVIEMSRGAAVTMVGPSRAATLVVPSEGACLSLTSKTHGLKTATVLPFSLLALPTSTERLCYPDREEILFIQLVDGFSLPHLEQLAAASVTIRHADILNAVQMLRRHLLSDVPIDTNYVDACVSIMVFQTESIAKNMGAPRVRRQFDDAQWIQLNELIDTRLEQAISVSELADAIGYSPSQCSMAFKATVGYPPQEYIRERRLTKARTLLQSTNESLAGIALACGFCSQAHMTAMFSRVLGITPGRYRREHVGGQPVAAHRHVT